MEGVCHEATIEDVPLTPDVVEFTTEYQGHQVACRIGFENLARFGSPRARPGEALNTREAWWACFQAIRHQVRDIAAPHSDRLPRARRLHLQQAQHCTRDSSAQSSG